MEKLINKIPKELKTLDFIDGHQKFIGKSAGQELNSIVLVENKEEKEFYIMFCNPDNITYFSKEDLNKVLYNEDGERITWSMNNKLGYILSNVLPNGKRLFLHQLIMDYSGNGKGQNSIDHINQNKLDNRRENLRITTQSVQNENRGKRARMSNAIKKIPDEVLDYIEEIEGHRDLQKFVEYNTEVKNEKIIKEYFQISKKHPLLKKFNYPAIKTQQGLTINILDKYLQIEKGINFLNNLIEKPQEEWNFNKDEFIEMMRE